MLPRIVVNAKAYPEVLGPGILRLAKAAQDAGRERGTHVALAVPATAIASVAEARLDHVALMAQHVDPHPPGAATGWLPVEAIQAAGAMGSLLNHAEHKVQHDAVRQCVARLTAARLWSVVCADSRAELQALAPLRPTYVAIEPPELIGGNVSVTAADPAIVRDAAADTRRLAQGSLTLCGAGVKGRADVAKAIELGAHGVLLASGVVKAPDARKVLDEMLAAVP